MKRNQFNEPQASEGPPFKRYAHVWFCPTHDRALDRAEVDYRDHEGLSRHLNGQDACGQPVWSVAIPTDIVRAFHEFWSKPQYRDEMGG